MPADRKVTDEELARLRHLADDGWSVSALAEVFGITPQHCGRLVRGDQRPVIGHADGEQVPTAVVAAVDDYLNAIRLDRGGEVLAETVKALARKLDACAASDAAAAAQSAPRIAAQMVDVLGRLQAITPREPDAIDRLRLQRAARQAAARVQGEPSFPAPATWRGPDGSRTA